MNHDGRFRCVTLWACGRPDVEMKCTSNVILFSSLLEQDVDPGTQSDSVSGLLHEHSKNIIIGALFSHDRLSNHATCWCCPSWGAGMMESCKWHNFAIILQLVLHSFPIIEIDQCRPWLPSPWPTGP